MWGQKKFKSKNGTCSNHLPKRQHGWNLQCIWLQIILQKYPKVDFFMGSLLQMFKSNEFNRDRCRTFIVQFPCLKDEIFFVCLNHFRKSCFQTLRSRILHLFLFSGNPKTILKPLHRQSFLPASIPAWTIFLTSFSPQINNLFPATFMFELSHSPCFKSSINGLRYLS